MKVVSKLLEVAFKPAAMRILLAWERLESGVSYNPLSPELRANPYPTYEKLRNKDPVHRIRLHKAWVFTQFEDVDAILRDHRRFSNGRPQLGYVPYTTMLGLDPPDHTRLRSLVSKGFTPGSVAELASSIQRTVDQLLDDVGDRGHFDLMREFAYPLPIIVIAEMLGVPPKDRDQFNDWSNIVSLVVDPLLQPEQIERVQQTVEELIAYFEEMAEARRANPQNDLISTLVAAEEAGDKLTREELVVNLILLLVAGNETTRNLIGNGTLALLRNPDQLQRLRDNTGLLDSAIDELLRYDSPVQLDTRITKEAVEFRGKRIPKGGRVICLLGAANRDPSAFPNPAVLDIGRTQRNHVAFGRGIHHCLGSLLAQLEGTIAFTALLDRFSSIHLSAEPKYRNQIVLRGLEELWVDVAPQPPRDPGPCWGPCWGPCLLEPGWEPGWEPGRRSYRGPVRRKIRKTTR